MSPESLALIMDMHEALEPFDGFREWNAVSQRAFVRHCQNLGKPLAQLTIEDLQNAAQAANEAAADYFALLRTPA